MQKNWSETLVMIAEIEGRGLHDSPYRSFLQCLSPAFRGKKKQPWKLQAVAAFQQMKNEESLKFALRS